MKESQALLLSTTLPPRRGETALEARFRDFIADRAFPCVGAKSALGRGGLEVMVARDITSSWDDVRISEALLDYAARFRRDPTPFQSFAVLFAGPATLDETGFEEALWARVQSLSDKDVWLGQPWDGRVSDDPDNPHFSLSFGGQAFFIVGLHPGASRPARRFETPVLVFNAHEQFEQLRQEGRYEQLRSKIIERDVAVAGSANPMLARFGDASEARQYSGRAVSDGWQCPFAPRRRWNRR